VDGISLSGIPGVHSHVYEGKRTEQGVRQRGHRGTSGLAPCTASTAVGKGSPGSAGVAGYAGVKVEIMNHNTL